VNRGRSFCFVVWTPRDGALVVPASWFVPNIANKAIPDRIAGWVGGRKGDGWSFGVAANGEDRLTVSAKTMERFVFATPAEAAKLLSGTARLEVSFSPRSAAPDLSKELLAAAKRANEASLYHLSNGVPLDQRQREIKFALRRLNNEDKKSGTIAPSLRIENGPIGRLLKAWAQYRCQVVGCPLRGFPTKEGLPYVEAHYLDELADASLTVPENVVVLCAHHHRMFHHAEVKRTGEPTSFDVAGRHRVEVRRFRFSDRKRGQIRSEPSLLSFGTQ